MSFIISWAKQTPFEDDYDLMEVMGRGRFGTVNRCQHKRSGEYFAAKIVDKRAARKGFTKEKAQLEVEILKKINHPNCMHMVDVYESRQKMVLVLELIAGGELFHRIASKETFTELEAISVIKSILLGLVYLHGLNIVHRDLKPENILLKGDNLDSGIKLIDFGLSVIHTGKPIKELCGTPEYQAPEIINFEDTTTAADMWAVGVITYLLLSGELPFQGDTEAETHTQINKGVINWAEDFDKMPSKLAQDFISNLLQRQPKKRMTAAQSLESPWIKMGDAAKKAKEAPHQPGSLVSEARKALGEKISLVNTNKIKQFNAQERWRRVLGTIQAAQDHPKVLKHVETDAHRVKGHAIRTLLEAVPNPGDSDTDAYLSEDDDGSLPYSPRAPRQVSMTDLLAGTEMSVIAGAAGSGRVTPTPFRGSKLGDVSANSSSTNLIAGTTSESTNQKPPLTPTTTPATSTTRFPTATAATTTTTSTLSEQEDSMTDLVPTLNLKAAPRRRSSTKPIVSVADFVNPIVRGEVSMTVQAVNCVTVATGVNGQVFVRNIAYEKKVVIEWTHDAWAHVHYTMATYSHSQTPSVDVFRFVLSCAPGTQVCYKVHYECGGQYFFDDNKGQCFRSVAVAADRRPSQTPLGAAC